LRYIELVMLLYFHPDSIWQIYAGVVLAFLAILAPAALLYYILYNLLKRRLDKKDAISKSTR